MRHQAKSKLNINLRLQLNLAKLNQLINLLSHSKTEHTKYTKKVT